MWDGTYDPEKKYCRTCMYYEQLRQRKSKYSTPVDVGICLQTDNEVYGFKYCKYWRKPKDGS